MFFYQSPWMPELLLQSNDFSMLNDIFRNRPMGMVNKDSMNDEDIDVFKYTFSQRGNNELVNHLVLSSFYYLFDDSGTCKAAINYYRALFQYQSDFSRAEISAPVLLLWGCQDQALGEELADASSKYCSDIRVKKIPRASHWINQDVPDMVNTLMEVFLNENPITEHIYDF
jgi:epoxide hydrolase 4